MLMTLMLCGKERRDKLGILFYFWWELWKESNRRVLQASERCSLQIAILIQDSLAIYSFGHA
jgi:hypothetical protein